MLNNLEVDLLYENLKKSNVLFEKNEIINYVKNLKKNIKIIQNKDRVKKNDFNNNLLEYIGSKNTANVLFAFKDSKNEEIFICKNEMHLCKNFQFKTNDILSLLSQRLQIDKSHVIFLGNISKNNVISMISAEEKELKVIKKAKTIQIILAPFNLEKRLEKEYEKLNKIGLRLELNKKYN